MRQGDLCVKFYRLPSEFTSKTRLSVRFEILLARFCPLLNVNCQEWRYHQRVLQRLPRELSEVFPEKILPAYSRERGWGIVESLIRNWDNAPVKSVYTEMRQSSDLQTKRHLIKAVAELFDQLVKHTVCFYDPPNVLVQWTGPASFQLRIVDFEPRLRALIPGLSYIRPYVRCKVRRRCRRHLQRLRNTFFIPGSTGVIPARSTRMPTSGSTRL